MKNKLITALVAAVFFAIGMKIRKTIIDSRMKVEVRVSSCSCLESVYEEYPPDDIFLVYVVSEQEDDDGATVLLDWGFAYDETYNTERIIVIEQFNGQIRPSHLKEFIDELPSIRDRNGEKPKIDRVIITTDKEPMDWYDNEQERQELMNMVDDCVRYEKKTEKMRKEE